MTGDAIATRSIPTYELYGELLAGSYTDPVHHETIEERSRQHDWTIRLHRHSSLAQIFLFRNPGVFVRLGDLEYTSTEPLLLVVPPGVAHGFRFSKHVSGDVLSLRVQELSRASNDRLEQIMASGGILSHSNSTYFDSVDALVQQLRASYQGLATERAALLAAMTELLLVYLSADLGQETTLGSVNTPIHLTRHEAQADQFCTLIEGHFDESWSVDDYARSIGVSAPHLTRVCRKILSASPNELVRQRRILEAKRLLEYTRLSISEIAHRCGFLDAAFFSRTFKKLVGVAPQAYRSDQDL